MNVSLIQSPLLLSIGIRDREALGWIRAKAPLLFGLAMQPIIDAEMLRLTEQMTRAKRVGRDPRGCWDFGHSIRQAALVDYDGTQLRGADVEISEEADPTSPNDIVRRARRSDSLYTLKTTGTLSNAQYQAGECLRDDLERAMTTLPAWNALNGPRMPPWNRNGVTDHQVIAMASVRAAFATTDRGDRMVLAWVIAGGSISGFAKLSRRHHRGVTTSLRAALECLVDYYALLGTAP